MISLRGDCAPRPWRLPLTREPFDIASQQHTVAVRTLCEFTAKAGDLDLRFTPSATALEGMAGHAMVAGRRGPDYEAELSLSGDYETLHVRGRADGYDAERGVLEEIKTFRGDLQAMPDNRRHLHWAQLKVYGAMLCAARGLKTLRLALVYFDVVSQAETVLRIEAEASELQAFFEDHCRRFLAWAEQELAHRGARDEALATLRFPHADFRPGQRPLSEAVFRAATSGRCLMAQAPTGIGKTVGTIFPLLKASVGERLDKIFFLAAKGPGRWLALDALHTIRKQSPAMPLRVLELVAKEKACEHPGKACHGEACPLARGFYDRLPAARSAALTAPMLDRTALRSAAAKHEVCPYYLAQELVRWADVVVADYNYYFDTSALLHGMTAVNEWRVALLVDEAHNLVARARAMYSAELPRSALAALRPIAPAVLKPALGRLDRCWGDLERGQPEPYAAHEDLPEPLLAALQNLNGAMADYLAAEPAGIDSTLLDFYFETLHFTRLAESFGDHSIFDSTLDATRGGSVLCLRNLVPAPFLKPRFAAAHTATLFSATLTPVQFHLDLLGLPSDTAWLDAASPFQADQLQVRLVGEISTRFHDRDDSVEPIVELMARHYAQQPGNYLAFFSSYDYLRKVAALLRSRHAGIELWEQTPQMDEAARERFLARFEPEGQGIGFAVLGGAFAEGIDLPGRRLIGAFIATLGLPPVNPVNEQLMARMERLFGAGYDYAYLYPGLQKVVQAARRVIRGPTDSGTLYLIDDRFARKKVQRLLPAWWQLPGVRLV